jgi:secreted trypsin-like serine protease
MSRRLLLGPLVLALVLLTSAAPGAVSARHAPAGDHPYIGFALFGANGSVSHSCSGAMLSPRVFLTAGHCTAGADIVLVWIDPSGPFDASTAVTGQPVTHPAFAGFAGYPDSNDLGVVLLDEPVDLAGYAALPSPGALDGLLADANRSPAAFTTVGFGLQTVVPFMQEGYTRLVSVPLLVALSDPPTDGFNMHMNGVSPRRRGQGTCMGDGGRPVFLGDSNVVVGIGSVLSASSCGGSGVYFRLDTPFAQEFLRGVLQ